MAFGVRLVLKRDNKKFDAREQTARETGEEGPAVGRAGGFRYVL
jgi:hypothetical protein